MTIVRGFKFEFVINTCCAGQVVELKHIQFKVFLESITDRYQKLRKESAM